MARFFEMIKVLNFRKDSVFGENFTKVFFTSLN